MRRSERSRLGWILVHSPKYVDHEISLANELRSRVRKNHNPLWHWKLAKPMKEGGPYVVLFAYEGEVFANAIGWVTREVRREMKQRSSLCVPTDSRKLSQETSPAHSTQPWEEGKKTSLLD